MNDRSDKLFAARLSDLTDQARRNSSYAFSSFLDERQCAEAEAWCRKNTGELMYRLWGGFPDARRKMLAVYHDYCDDGVRFLNGTEESSGSIMSSSSYRADLRMTDAEGKELGYLEANIGFTAAYSISHLFSGNFSPDLKKESTAFSQYQGISLNLSELVP